MRLTLTPHPAGPSSPIERVEVKVNREPDGQLHFGFSMEGDLEAVALPDFTSQWRRTDELWRHTCLEAFVRNEGEESYSEFNFAPSSDWAAYRFDRYREGMTDLPDDVLGEIFVAGGKTSFKLEARMFPPKPRNDRSLCVALSAVIEDVRGEKTYWALAHPSDKPDFHHPDSFVLELPPEPA